MDNRVKPFDFGHFSLFFGHNPQEIPSSFVPIKLLTNTKGKTMKTIKIIGIMLFLSATTGIIAQDKAISPTRSVVENEVRGDRFEIFANNIAWAEDFNYRKELKNAKLNHTLFHFPDTSITKTQMLRHFKRAARKSESADEFVRYLQDKKLLFIDLLDYKTVLGIYDNMQVSTFNGYLNMLELMCSI